MTISSELLTLNETKTAFKDMIESAGLPIPEGSTFRDYVQHLSTALSISTLINFLDGIPADVAFSRASTKMHEQPDGSFVEIPAEVPEYKGMRFVENLSGLITAFSTRAGATIVGVTTIDGRSCLQVDFAANRSSTGIQFQKNGVIGETRTVSIDVYAASGADVTRAATFAKWPEFGGGEFHGSLSNTWIRVASTSEYILEAAYHGVLLNTGPLGATLYFAQPQLEVGDNASEFVDPSVDHGYSVAGAEYLTTEYANTIAANGVVTEAVGADLPGPFKLQLDSTAINHLPDAFDFTAPSGWVAGSLNVTQGDVDSFGTSTKLVATNTLDTHQLLINGLNLPNDKYAIKCKAKPDEESVLSISVYQSGVINISVDVNTLDGTYTSTAGFETITVTEPDSHGFRDIVLVLNIVNYTDFYVIFRLRGSAAVYTGDNVSGLHINAAQLVLESVDQKVVNGTVLSDGLSVDLSAYTDKQITSAKIKYYDGSDNLVVEDLSGPEIIVNGDFSNGLSDWTVNENGQTVEVSAGSLHVISSGALCGVSQAAVFTAGNQYLISAEVNVGSGVGLKFSTGVEFLMESTGSYLFTHAAAADSALFVYRRGSAGTDSTIDDVSVRLINPACTFDSITKILTFNTPISLDIKPVVIL